MKLLAEGLSFGEGPRWHDGALYFSDFYRHVVQRLSLDGTLEVVAEVENQPSGLGWLPDGRLLIVSMLDRKLLRQETDGSLAVHAELEELAAWHCNDMVVDASGRAYVGNFGFDTHTPGTPERGANLVRVDPDGSIHLAAEDLKFPNGTVITPDGKTLIIGETRANRLTAFDVGEDGTLSNRRIWAPLGANFPDGIALDAENCVWVADPRNNCLIRVREGGEVAQTIELDRGAYACALGGPDRRTLFIIAATGSGEHARARRDGQILTVEVDVGGAGLP